MRARTTFAHGPCGAIALLAASGASAVAGGLAAASCITAPPPDLPQLPTERPTIENDAVQPPEGLLTEWPIDNQFSVPVEVGNPVDFTFYVFVDYPAIPTYALMGSLMNPPDAGITLVDFTLGPPDSLICPHQIQFLVANSFNAISPHTPTTSGGDIATWEYYAGGNAECPSYDAGDGSFPDAVPDGIPVAPESGGDL